MQQTAHKVVSNIPFDLQILKLYAEKPSGALLRVREDIKRKHAKY